jgi:hypothetical protein
MADARRFNEFVGGNGSRQQECRRLARLECSQLPHWHIVDEFINLAVVVGG